MTSHYKAVGVGGWGVVVSYLDSETKKREKRFRRFEGARKFNGNVKIYIMMQEVAHIRVSPSHFV